MLLMLRSDHETVWRASGWDSLPYVSMNSCHRTRGFSTSGDLVLISILGRGVEGSAFAVSAVKFQLKDRRRQRRGVWKRQWALCSILLIDLCSGLAKESGQALANAVRSKENLLEAQTHFDLAFGKLRKSGSSLLQTRSLQRALSDGLPTGDQELNNNRMYRIPTKRPLALYIVVNEHPVYVSTSSYISIYIYVNILTY